MGRGRGAPGGRTPARGAGGGGRRRAAAPDASVRAPPPPHPHPRRRAPGGAASFPPQRAVEPEPGRAELWMRRSGCSAGHREGGVVVGGGKRRKREGGAGARTPGAAAARVTGERVSPRPRAHRPARGRGTRARGVAPPRCRGRAWGAQPPPPSPEGVPWEYSPRGTRGDPKGQSRGSSLVCQSP